jgi:hypothetical protein
MEKDENQIKYMGLEVPTQEQQKQHYNNYFFSKKENLPNKSLKKVIKT